MAAAHIQALRSVNDDVVLLNGRDGLEFPSILP